MSGLQRRGYEALPRFLTTHECARLLGDITAYRASHDIPLVQRPARGRSLHYRVINGDDIAAHLPRIAALYEAANATVNDLWGSSLVPLENRTVGVNVNITPPGGEYRWHYDRNAATAVLYLNKVTGGDVEIYPNYRVFLGRGKLSRFQQVLDRALQTTVLSRLIRKRQVTISPAPGHMVVMRGDRCLHSVTAVEGDAERVCIVMSYDVPGATFVQGEALDRYLYTSDSDDARKDPNYTRG